MSPFSCEDLRSLIPHAAEYSFMPISHIFKTPTNSFIYSFNPTIPSIDWVADPRS